MKGLASLAHMTGTWLIDRHFGILGGARLRPEGQYPWGWDGPRRDAERQEWVAKSK
jgi:hypothetical protein